MNGNRLNIPPEESLKPGDPIYQYTQVVEASESPEYAKQACQKTKSAALSKLIRAPWFILITSDEEVIAVDTLFRGKRDDGKIDKEAVLELLEKGRKAIERLPD